MAWRPAAAGPPSLERVQPQTLFASIGITHVL
jgi:hypothetical protein